MSTEARVVRWLKSPAPGMICLNLPEVRNLSPLPLAREDEGGGLWAIREGA